MTAAKKNQVVSGSIELADPQVLTDQAQEEAVKQVAVELGVELADKTGPTAPEPSIFELDHLVAQVKHAQKRVEEVYDYARDVPNSILLKKIAAYELQRAYKRLEEYVEEYAGSLGDDLKAVQF